MTRSTLVPCGVPAAPAEFAPELSGLLTAAGGELQQLRALLADAVEKLLATFGSLQQLAEEQRRIASGPGASAAAGELAAQVDRDIRAAVTALQFQDMATQLLDHTARRIAVADAVIWSLVASGAEPASPDPLYAALEALADAGKASPVCQREIVSGTVELF